MKSGTVKSVSITVFFFGGEEGDAAKQHQGADREHDRADAQIGDEVALDETDHAGDADRDHGRGRRTELVGEAHDDHGGQRGVGANRQIDFARDDAQGER